VVQEPKVLRVAEDLEIVLALQRQQELLEVFILEPLDQTEFQPL
jgi:hypothetical protein